ncbi:LysR family transcriptional regulator [filamentous cyanobacterium LEGE 11480]|uniref:LysR family transcriptional regulator n=1 Tax=Romeriopsis navalis LEGE 11480 TaxID=2777977 RepID=A0A928VKF0_9CYAN|nr:LysR family transcriptional regulator [Romeriopsis navalis]MBE9028241.1 LysR family transcriptional regulator [Romeriopsis navalis LEGE 11480]
MDLYQIRYFLTIAEVGSFTKAAELLYVSQPSLSAGIKKLEKELDVMLLERGGRGVLLTPAGRLFQARGQAILAEYQAVRQDFQVLKAQPTLRIGMLHTIRGSCMAKVIGAFNQRHPQVSITIYHGYLQELQDWLAQGKVDLALSWLQEQDDPQTSQLLFHQPLTLAVPQSHVFAQAKSVCLADLDGQPYIERLNCEFWRSNQDMFESAGVKPRNVYSSNNEEWVISLIQAGMGMSIMPIWQDLVNTTYVPMTDLSLSRTIGLRWRGQQQLETVAWFRDFALEHDWQVAG